MEARESAVSVSPSAADESNLKAAKAKKQRDPPPIKGVTTALAAVGVDPLSVKKTIVQKRKSTRGRKRYVYDLPDSIIPVRGKHNCLRFRLNPAALAKKVADASENPAQHNPAAPATKKLCRVKKPKFHGVAKRGALTAAGQILFNTAKMELQKVVMKANKSKKEAGNSDAKPPTPSTSTEPTTPSKKTAPLLSPRLSLDSTPQSSPEAAVSRDQDGFVVPQVQSAPRVLRASSSSAPAPPGSPNVDASLVSESQTSISETDDESPSTVQPQSKDLLSPTRAHSSKSSISVARLQANNYSRTSSPVFNGSAGGGAAKARGGSVDRQTRSVSLAPTTQDSDTPVEFSERTFRVARQLRNIGCIHSEPVSKWVAYAETLLTNTEENSQRNLRHRRKSSVQQLSISVDQPAAENGSEALKRKAEDCDPSDEQPSKKLSPLRLITPPLSPGKTCASVSTSSSSSSLSASSAIENKPPSPAPDVETPSSVPQKRKRGRPLGSTKEKKASLSIVASPAPTPTTADEGLELIQDSMDDVPLALMRQIRKRANESPVKATGISVQPLPLCKSGKADDEADRDVKVELDLSEIHVNPPKLPPPPHRSLAERQILIDKQYDAALAKMHPNHKSSVGGARPAPSAAPQCMQAREPTWNLDAGVSLTEFDTMLRLRLFELAELIEAARATHHVEDAVEEFVAKVRSKRRKPTERPEADPETDHADVRAQAVAIATEALISVDNPP